MNAFQEFEGCLQEALEHLYDPAYRPAEALWSAMGHDPRQGMKALQRALISEIGSLKPEPNVPPNARSWRIYGLLSGIYLQGLTQEETAERLCITPRHLRRERPEAIHALALRIWEQNETEEATQETATRLPDRAPSDAQSLKWRSQVRQELASLRECAPGTMTDVGASVQSAIELAKALTRERGVDLQAERLQPGLIVEVHPSALRQVLIAAIGQLAQHMSSGEVILSAERRDRNAAITVSGYPVAAPHSLNPAFVQEMIAAQGGTLTTEAKGLWASFLIELPALSHTVLVVDDNRDIAHLYRRYALGTSYHIVDAAQGQRALELVETLDPDIIVLDVMLPDVDGWELLSHLREHPVAHATPILVCSVVREKDLALALGADLYLAKPIQRQEFIAALDRLLSQALASEQTPPASNPVAY